MRPMLLRAPVRRPLPRWLALVGLALLWGCAEGAPGTGEEGDGASDAVLDASDGTGGDASDVVAGGELELCVLNEGGPQGACEDPAELDFGMLSPGATETRLFRLDNETGDDLTVTQTAFDTPNGAMSILPVRYEPQAGSPGSFVRTEPTLPAALDAGSALWFEVSAQPGGQAGALPATKVIVLLTGGPPATTGRVEVPLTGEQSGCPMGTGDCDGDATNGCEADLLGSATHCGSCGAGCNPPSGTGMCVAGACTITACETGRGDCDENARNGCETDLTRTSQHCGACGTACTNLEGTTSCVAGACSPMCTATFGDCDGDPANGCETSLDSLEHCGLCGESCAPTDATGDCSSGTCAIAVCNDGRGDCDGDPANGCEIDTSSEVIHCGGCNTLCTNDNGTTSCNGGQCTPSCNSGFGDCDGNSQNGCEYVLDTNPACGSFTALSSVRGDSGSDVVTQTGFGEAWYRVNVREDSSGFCSADDLCAVFDLDVPAGTDYDLYVYCSDCNGADNSSTNTGDANESTHVRWDEDTVLGCPSGSDSGRDIYVHVALFGGNTCAPYTLTVTGHACRSGNTCGSR